MSCSARLFALDIRFVGLAFKKLMSQVKKESSNSRYTMCYLYANCSVVRYIVVSPRVREIKLD